MFLNGTTQVLVQLAPVRNAKAYQVQTRTNGGKTWVEAGISTQTRRIVLTNLMPGMTYAVRARGIGGSTGPATGPAPAGHGGAVDQGRQERRQMDPPVLSRLWGQSSAVAPVRAGLQSGQLSASDGAAPSSSSLDVDDAAGKTDQDWGEGGSPFPEDCFPNGGSGGAARVVPGHFGRDWAAAIGNRDVRMKADIDKTTATTKVVSSHPGETRQWSQKWGRNTASAEKNR